VKVRVDWNASPDTKALVDKALELEREDDKVNSRTPRSKSSIIDTIMRQGLSRYLAEREPIRKQPTGETHV
jgi:dissimilatory sulfite reductase (desulfoviridin) alpha/beta subunit